MNRRQNSRDLDWKMVSEGDAHWYEYQVGAFVIVFRSVDDCDWCIEVWRQKDRANPIGAPLFFTDPCGWEIASGRSRAFVEAFDRLNAFLPTGDRSPVTPPTHVGNKSS